MIIHMKETMYAYPFLEKKFSKVKRVYIKYITDLLCYN
jgi:hypothetical protein